MVSDEARDSSTLDRQIEGLAHRLVGGRQPGPHQPSDFSGGRGDENLPDDAMFEGLKAVFQADHRAYKERGYYDFPPPSVQSSRHVRPVRNGPPPPPCPETLPPTCSNPKWSNPYKRSSKKPRSSCAHMALGWAPTARSCVSARMALTWAPTARSCVSARMALTWAPTARSCVSARMALGWLKCGGKGFSLFSSPHFEKEP